jgi:hypothetical protein
MNSIFLSRVVSAGDFFLRGLERQKQIEAIAEVNVQVSTARIAALGG